MFLRWIDGSRFVSGSIANILASLHTSSLLDFAIVTEITTFPTKIWFRTISIAEAQPWFNDTLSDANIFIRSEGNTSVCYVSESWLKEMHCWSVMCHLKYFRGTQVDPFLMLSMSWSEWLQVQMIECIALDLEVMLMFSSNVVIHTIAITLAAAFIFQKS